MEFGLWWMGGGVVVMVSVKEVKFGGVGSTLSGSCLRLNWCVYYSELLCIILKINAI